MKKITRRDFGVGLASLAITNPVAGLDRLISDKGENVTFQLSNRRYIGCKQKLLDWIFEKIHNVAPEATSLFDVFSGTGVVAERALKEYDRVIINDLLYSNHIVYEAVFGAGDVDHEKLNSIVKEYNSVDVSAVDDNYFSRNYGGKYFETELSKLIGWIRDDIERRTPLLTKKERSILLASLIYSIDCHANTCGHFEAYIKKPIPVRDFKYGLISYSSYKGAEIYREDSNSLARKVSADVAYIDPPYNSRQYSRFYHVYETLIKWDAPELFGVARKPKPENMSEYCRNGAFNVFTDLVQNLRCKYLVVSYNNTYASKSKSSENKISLEEIKSALESVGETSVYTAKHNFYNAGKTDFEDHKEYLFVTKKKEHVQSFMRSPFFYVGDKYKLLPAIIPQFPTGIDRFIEPFVGGGSVFLNVRAKSYLLNDIDCNIIDLHRHLCRQSTRVDAWIEELYALMCEYGLSRSFREDVVPDALKREFVKTYYAKFNKDAFARLRSDYNASTRTTKADLDRLYLLLIYGFNRMLRYNSKGDYNLPVGNVDFNTNVKEAIDAYAKRVSTRDMVFSSMQFDEFMRQVNPQRNDFVYCDPPYLITGSEYNKIWHEEEDLRLMRALDALNEKGVRFAVSNVTHYRGKVNQAFLEWAVKYRSIPVKSNYINYHDNTEKLINEVLVVNYEKA